MVVHLVSRRLFTQVVQLRVFRTGLIIMVVYLRFKKGRSLGPVWLILCVHHVASFLCRLFDNFGLFNNCFALNIFHFVCSGNQEVKPVSSISSPNHSHSPEVSSRIMTDDETQEAETAKSLNEKLLLATILNDSSPQHGQSPQPEVCQPPQPEDGDVQDSVKSLNEKVSPKIRDDDVQDSMKSLNEKLSAALLTISAKENLVKQHTRVAEEAVAGTLFFPIGLHLINFAV